MATTTRIRPDMTAPATASRLKTRLRGGQQIAVDTSASSFIEGYRRVGVYMATGTGKTKTCIALIYRLLKAKRFRRILFLVDRSAL